MSSMARCSTNSQGLRFMIGKMSVKKQTKNKSTKTRTSNYTKYPGELPATKRLEQHKVPSRVQDNTDSKELHRVPLRAPEDKLNLPELHRVPPRVL